MKSFRRLGCLLGSLLLEAGPLCAQTTLVDSIQSGGQWRSYRLYVPAGYQPGAPVPLLLNLHGLGSNAFEQENYGDFRPIADTAHFLIVHPNGTFNGTQRFWNGFGLTPPNDVAFLSALIDSIGAAYAVDPDRIYSTGMSNGGIMTYELACQLSPRLAAVASVTGTMATTRIAPCSPAHPMPVLEIHGTADNTVPYTGTALLAAIPQVLNYWVQFNQCNPTPTVTALPNLVTTDNSTAERQVWTGGRNGTEVVHYRIVGGGHTWPGSAFTIGVTNRDINASVEVWRFLRRWRLSGLVVTGAPADQPAAAGIGLLPNPVGADGWVTLAGVPGGAPLRVTDVFGRPVSTLPEAAYGGLRLDTRAWPAGVYVVRGTANGRPWQRRLVK